MRGVRYLLVIAVALALAGCGGDANPTPDAAALERDLARTVEQRTGTRGVTVDCPDGARDEDDVCTVTAPGGVRSKVTVGGKLVQP